MPCSSTAACRTPPALAPVRLLCTALCFHLIAHARPADHCRHEKRAPATCPREGAVACAQQAAAAAVLAVSRAKGSSARYVALPTQHAAEPVACEQPDYHDDALLARAAVAFEAPSLAHQRFRVCGSVDCCICGFIR